MSSITWWLGIAALAFTGGIAIGFGVSWLFLPFRSQAEPGALSEWPPMLGAFRQHVRPSGEPCDCGWPDAPHATLSNHKKARFIAEQWRERWRRINETNSGAVSHSARTTTRPDG
jgi:hypothetical protein